MARASDVLRPLFSGFIERKHRKVYGEYFTPDWLADRIVREMLDDEWIRKQLFHLNAKGPVKNVGVLDPACGSGTFLYHSIRRIVESKPVEQEALSPLQKANFAVRLVCGIDIHPVAVEMARASILRALPAAPSESIHVIQGDSLLIERADVMSSVKRLEIVSREGMIIYVPFNFAQYPSFDDDLNALVKTADKQASIPPRVLRGKSQETKDELKTLHSVLSKVCAVEGNGVWAWHIRNRMAPHVLKERKVDRIVTNPPWVSLRGIQDRVRKSEIKDLAETNRLWVGGRNATTFNVAALFVNQCSKLYLAEKNRSAWVLPDAALTAENWENFRIQHDHQTREIWDVGQFPFPKQSASCVRIHQSTKKRGGISYKKLMLKERSRTTDIETHDSWERVSRHLEWSDGNQPDFLHLNSVWLSGSAPRPKQGATLSPFCLLRVKDYKLIGNHYEIYTQASRQDPWKDLRTQHAIIPKHWLLEAIYNSDLFPYYVGEPCSRIVAPVNRDLTGFEEDPDLNAYWIKASQLYSNKHGKGTSTPKTLLGQINYHGKFTSQLNRGNSSSKSLVVHNNSGALFCAARTSTLPIVNNDTIWLRTNSAKEAKFLLGLLNSDALLPAIKSTQTNARHYALNVWKKLPIPRFVAKESSHCELSDLASEAEKFARKIVLDIGVDQVSPKRGREAVREGLRNSGLSADIDRLVAHLLPDYVR